MPKGYDSSQHPARKVGKDAFQRQQEQQPYAPHTMGGGAGGKEPPKKKTDTGGKGDDSRKYPQEYQKKSNPDYHKPAPKTNEDDNKKSKSYPNKIGPKKKEENPHEGSKKRIPNDRKNPYPSKDDRGDKYKNGWYN